MNILFLFLIITNLFILKVISITSILVLLKILTKSYILLKKLFMNNI